MNDAELMARYADNPADQAPFAELVRRRLDLIYSAALRQVAGDTHRAEDLTQIVFADAARKASVLRHHPAVMAWLYTATRFAAVTMIRSEQSRHQREKEASTMHTNDSPSANWEQLRPVLDEAMHELDDTARRIILLRYFDRAPLAAVGAELGVSENAAQKRVDRALEKLRGLLHRRGITSTAAALATTLADQAVLASPAGLAAVLSSAAFTSEVAAGASGVGTAGALKLLLMITGKNLTTAVLAIFAAAGIGASVYEWSALRAVTEGRFGNATVDAKVHARLTAATARARDLEADLATAEVRAAKAAKVASDATTDFAERETAAMREIPARPAIPFNYGPVLAKLKVAPEKYSQLMNFLHLFEGTASFPNILTVEYLPDDLVIETQVESNRVDEVAALRSIVGEEGYEMIRQYRQTPEVNARQLISQVGSVAGSTLSDSQMEELFRVVLSGMRVREGAGPPSWLNTEYDPAILAQAAPLLSPEQLKLMQSTISRRNTIAAADQARSQMMARARERLAGASAAGPMASPASVATP